MEKLFGLMKNVNVYMIVISPIWRKFVLAFFLPLQVFNSPASPLPLMHAPSGFQPTGIILPTSIEQLLTSTIKPATGIQFIHKPL